MGWKKFKEKFKIEHQVCVSDNYILIGSSYVSNLVSINMRTGELVKNNTFPDFLEKHYPDILKSSKQEILDVINEKDKFKEKVPVFSYDGGRIVKDFCEELGWPNVTYSGKLMYNNEFFDTKQKAIDKAIKNNDYAVEDLEKRIEKLKKDIKNIEQELSIKKDIQKKLRNMD